MAEIETYERFYQVTCGRTDCPQPDDAFQVRYTVAVENGKYTVADKAIGRTRPPAYQKPKAATQWGMINRKCPWCLREKDFSVPLDGI
jgi:hypothetical protein